MVSTKVAKEFVEGLLPVAEKLIKGGKTKKAEELLIVPKKDLKVGDKTVTVTDEGTESVFKVDKKDLAKKNIKIKEIKPFKKVKDIGLDEADDVLFKYNATKITPKILDDFNISKFKNKEDIAKFIELISKKYTKEIDRQKRGIQTEEQLKFLSTWLQKDPKKLQRTILSLRPGQTLNAEYMYAARELLAAGMAKLNTMAKFVDAGKANDLQKLEFRQHFALMSEFQKIVKGVQTETARTFRQFQTKTREQRFTHIDLDDLNKNDLLLELGGPSETKTLATMFLRTGTNRGKMKFAQETGGFANLKKVSDSIAEIFINSILSNPMTHIRNTGGNWVAQAIIQMERSAVAKLHGGTVKGGVAAYEDIARAYGKSMAAQEMMAALSVALRGKSLKQILKNFDELIPATHGGTKIEMRSHRLSSSNFNDPTGATDLIGRILTIDRIPTRMLTTADNFFKNREYRAELYALAFRETMEALEKKTLKEADAPMFLADRVLNPTFNMAKAANEGMLYSVFQTKMQSRTDVLGKLGQLAQKTKGGTGYFTWLTNYYIPFTQTPINIAGFVAERTPVLAKLLTRHSQEIEAGGARKQMAEMRLRLGSYFYYGMVIPGYFGVTSGADINIPGKTTGGKYELMKGFNYQPNSIRLGGTQINLTGLDPLTTMISQGANLGAYTEAMLSHTYSGETGFNEKLMAEYTLAFVLSFGENLTNSTFLKGAGDFVNDIQRLNKVASGDMPGTRFLKKWSMDMAKAYIPSGAKQASKLTVNSDFQKLSTEWNTLIKSTMANKDLPTSYNMFGKPVGKFAFLSKYRHGPAENEVKSVMPRLTPKPKSLSINYNSLNGLNVTVPFSDKEQEFFDYNAGLLFTQNMETLIASEKYQNSERLVKEGYISEALGSARSEARKMLNSAGGKDSDYSKSEFFDSIQARGLDLLKDKFVSHNRNVPLSEETTEAFTTANEQLKTMENINQ